MQAINSYMRMLSRVSLTLFLCITGFISLGQDVYAQTSMPEGTVGWWFYQTGSDGYAPDPVTACSNTARNHLNSPLVEMRVYPSTTRVTYDCKYYFNPAAGADWYGQTQLMCDTGYAARWPGICTKIFEKPLPPPACGGGGGSGGGSGGPGAPGYGLGNPVVVSTGDKVQVEIDPLGTQQGTLQVARTYRTFSEAGTSAGINWSFSFDRIFETSSNTSGQPPTSVSGTADQGSYFLFTYANGVYTPASPVSGTLAPANSAYDEWIYKNTAGRIDYFKKINGKYKLISSHTKEGVGEYYAYDLNNRLQTISDSFGRSLQVTWKNEYVVDSIVGSDLSVHYEYDQVNIPASGFIPGTERLIQVNVTNVSGTLLTTKLYHYEDSSNHFLLTGITDENSNRFATYAYGVFGRAISSEHAGGVYRHTFSYTSDTSRVITDPLGTARTFSLANLNGFGRITSIDNPSGAGCGPASSSYAYGVNGNLSQVSDFNGNKTCYAFDPVRNLETGRIEGVDSATACPTIDTASLVGTQRKILTQWHPDLRLAVKVSGPLKRTTYIFNGQQDTNGQVLTCAPATSLPDGKPAVVACKRIEQATSDGNGAAGFNAALTGRARIWTFTYNALGQILTSNGPPGDSGVSETTTYAYYSDTTTTHTRGDLWTATNAKGHLTEFLEYNKPGQVTKFSGPNGEITTLTYDPLLRLANRTSAAGTAAAQTITYNYDSVGQLIKTTAPDTSFITYTYDPAHRLTDITDGLGNSAHFTLDNAGNRIQEVVKDVNGNLTRQVIREYDALNRLRQVTGATL